MNISTAKSIVVILITSLTALCLTARCQDYSITTTGNAIVITDVSGNGETISVSQNASNIRFAVSPDTRTYSVDGGPLTAFSTPAVITPAGITAITINAGAGDDLINFEGSFTFTFPGIICLRGALFYILTSHF